MPTPTPICDCTSYPFKPECYYICTAKYLAISSELDLKQVFGLPEEFAQKISKIPPNSRPHSLEGYSILLPSPVFTALELKTNTLTKKDYQFLRDDAMKRDLNFDQFQW